MLCVSDIVDDVDVVADDVVVSDIVGAHSTGVVDCIVVVVVVVVMVVKRACCCGCWC